MNEEGGPEPRAWLDTREVARSRIERRRATDRLNRGADNR